MKYQVTDSFGNGIKGVKAVLTTLMFMEGHELFSGGDKDPVSAGHMFADIVAKDDFGRCLPYDITVSIFPVDTIDRDICMVEDMCPRRRRAVQKIAVHIVVFENMEFYEKYMLEENCIIAQE